MSTGKPKSLIQKLKESNDKNNYPKNRKEKRAALKKMKKQKIGKIKI